MSGATSPRASNTPARARRRSDGDVTTTNDQRGADGSLDGLDDAHPADILGRLESGTDTALYTHEMPGYSSDESSADDSLVDQDASTDEVNDGPPAPPKPVWHGWRKPVLIGAAALVCVLAAAGGTVAEHDTLAPAADSEITDGSQIVLERGRLLTLTIDGQTRQVWTTAT